VRHLTAAELLLTESAQRFIEVGYQPYFAAFGEHFGSTVKYFFFDQPHATFYDWPQRHGSHGSLGSLGNHGSLGSSLPFAPRLADEVRQRTERSFGTALLALVMDVGPETAALRCDFYQAYTELACSSYLGTLAAWCHEHGVALSGHEVLGHVGSWNPGWEQQGFPAYSGVGHYTCTFDRNASRPRRLRLPRVSAAVEVTLNGRATGSRAWEPFEFELPELRDTANQLEITVFSAAANKYYSGTPYRQHPEPSGLLAAPTLISY
jgi:hypothetical protein